MTTNELIDRYIYAATKRINKKKTRDDIALELRSLIDDMLNERCGDALILEKDVRVVLTELGTPSEVYHKYNPNCGKALISGEYYDTYIYILRIVLLCTGFGLLIAYTVGLIQSGFNSPFDFFIKFLTGTLSSMCGIFTSFTIIFAVLERKKVSITVLDNDFDFNSLPPVPKVNETISRTESIFGIVMTILFTIILLFVPQIFSIWTSEEGAISVFNLEKLRSMWFIVLAFGAVGVFDQCLRLIERRHTLRVLISTLVTNALTLVFALILFYPADMVNTTFAASMQSLFSDSSLFSSILPQSNLILLGIIIFAIIIDVIQEIYYFIKYRSV